MGKNKEHVFQAKIMRDWILPTLLNSGKPFAWYPIVRSIGKERMISEIDLIVVEKDTQTVKGCEFKYLRYLDKWKNYPLVYQGLGQALLYFWHGIEQSILYVGVSMDIKDDIMPKIIQLTSAVDNLKKELVTRYIGLEVYDENGEVIRVVKPEGRYPVSKVKLAFEKKKKILSGEIGWSKKFLENYKLPEYSS